MSMCAIDLFSFFKHRLSLFIFVHNVVCGYQFTMGQYFQTLTIIILLLSLQFYVKGVKLECHIKKYDLDGDSMVTKEEFLTVTQDFKEMDTNILFQRLDKNGLFKVF